MDVIRWIGRGYRRSDRWLRRQSFGVRSLVILTGILALDVLTAVIAHPQHRWLPTFTILGAVTLVGTLVLISHLRRHRGSLEK